VKPGIEDEIRIVEERIARKRVALGEFTEECGERARDAVASPGILAAAMAVGFLIGDVTRGRRRQDEGTARKEGLGGFLIGAASTLVRVRYGSILALAQLLWNQAKTSPSRNSEARSLRRTPLSTSRPPDPVRMDPAALARE
jgi:hypothetical protein